ncbi:hypothetical protein SAMN05444358_1011446 [Ruegeria halocynthiae]|uniref:Hemolysin-type calcium-binding repeat-containing protein n=2 Tax=Ruegeria halocynthiae TaxID=985054 RepID=A0A1H2VDW7_9RHOB|nr:hypothetical protein SAMN05444358_1011446 [Ruegeria halocynthiae]
MPEGFDSKITSVSAGLLHTTFLTEDGDVLSGNRGDDIVSGAGGDDRLKGGTCNDTLLGRDGDDRFNGGWANDKLDVDTSDDRLSGGRGHDDLDGGDGDDRLNGGWGADNFVFNGGRDAIRNFDPGCDWWFWSHPGDQITIDIEGFDNFDDVIANASQEGQNTVIEFNEDDSLTL